MVVAVGAEAQLAGVSHECDWPDSVQHLPRVTTTPIDPTRTSAEIDRAVRDSVAAGRAVIGIDVATLRALAPTLIITQQLCDVCAVADGEAQRLATALADPPDVLVLQGTTLSGVWEDVRAVGVAVGRTVEADLVAQELELQVEALAARATERRPRVIAIEWLEPLFLAGHWVPEMIHAAGGIDVGAQPGDHSAQREWRELAALDPDVVLIMLCGFDEARAHRELAGMTNAAGRAWLAGRRVCVIDGNAYTSRPGPRLVEGITLIQRFLHAGTAPHL
jgi:iron complex transport system substrate-binding protein